MARIDRPPSPQGRDEVLQIALEAISTPAISIEHLLDRLAEPAGHDPAMQRNHPIDEGKPR